MSTVLVVDDEPDVRLVARLILEGAGHAVREVDSGEGALEALESDDLPDVVLLDVRLPGIDGWEVLRRLRSPAGGFVDLPVVVFTADISSVDHAPVLFREREVFLSKPFGSEQLLRSIDSATGVQV